MGKHQAPPQLYSTVQYSTPRTDRAWSQRVAPDGLELTRRRAQAFGSGPGLNGLKSRKREDWVVYVL